MAGKDLALVLGGHIAIPQDLLGPLVADREVEMSGDGGLEDINVDSIDLWG